MDFIKNMSITLRLIWTFVFIIPIAILWWDKIDLKKTIKDKIPFVIKENVQLFTFPDFVANNELNKDWSTRYVLDNKTRCYNIHADSRCPCGSGKKYRNCHHPSKDNSDKNFYRGCGFDKYVYVGYDIAHNGLDYSGGEKPEIVIIQGTNKIPVARYYVVDNNKLKSKAIVRSLIIEELDENVRLSIEIEVINSKVDNASIIVGTPDVYNADFEINRDAGYEKGKWIFYLGGDKPSFNGLLKPEWFRYFKSEGVKVDLKTNSIYKLDITIDKKTENLFSISLPFNVTELVSPILKTKSVDKKLNFEVDREFNSWDIAFYPEMFEESKNIHADRKVFVSERTEKMPSAPIRKTINGYCQLRLQLMNN